MFYLQISSTNLIFSLDDSVEEQCLDTINGRVVVTSHSGSVHLYKIVNPSTFLYIVHVYITAISFWDRYN
jgi:hypothetical protein